MCFIQLLITVLFNPSPNIFQAQSWISLERGRNLETMKAMSATITKFSLRFTIIQLSTPVELVHKNACSRPEDLKNHHLSPKMLQNWSISLAEPRYIDRHGVQPCRIILLSIFLHNYTFLGQQV